MAAPRTDVVASRGRALGLDRLMFEAADPSVFTRYIKTYGPDINLFLFVDHTQRVQIEAARSGLWGTSDVWDRVAAFRPRPSGRSVAFLHPTLCFPCFDSRGVEIPSRPGGKEVSCSSTMC